MHTFSQLASIRTALSSALIALGLAACGADSALSSGTHPLRISFTTRSPAAERATSSAADTGQLADADSVVLTKAQLVIREFELKAGRDHQCHDDNSGNTSSDERSGSNSGGRSGNEGRGRRGELEDDCQDIEFGPLLIDLPLNTGRSQFHLAVPEGEFRELELQIDKPENGDSAGRAFIERNPLLRDFSVLAEGFFGDKPFRFLARVRVRREFEFRPPLSVVEGGTDLTIRVRVGTWFRDADGRAIDPRTAVDGGPNASLVVRNIAHSIQAFADSGRVGGDR